MESTVQNNRKVKHYFGSLENSDIRKYIENVQTQCRLIEHRGQLFPITVNHSEYKNSYVCSIYTAFVPYAKEESSKIPNPLVRFSIQRLIAMLDSVLKRMQADQVVQVNNWFLSTNLFSMNQILGLDQLTLKIAKQYPDHAIVFRSLNNHSNAKLIKQFLAHGYYLLPTRQVYVFDGIKGFSLNQRSHKSDRKLHSKSSYAWVDHNAIFPKDFHRIVWLYNQLYIKKHSQHNPKYTHELIAHWHHTKTIEMAGLRNPQGVLDGVIGYFANASTMTVPLVGYDTALPQKLGLYRMLMTKVICDAHARKKVLNASSGAAHFKQLRGGQPHMEFAAAYVNHLPAHRKLSMVALCQLVQTIGTPLMQRYKL